tara:strand:- start:392 stop:1087 length:696 start_codon:yes stop_codon:yes gene_type:complete
MFKNKTFLAIIPARGGSKRLPNKNTANLYGKPLVAWTIEAAKKSKYLDEIILSTDSSKITEIGLKYKVNIPFVRPKKISGDKANSVDVLIHALNQIDKKYDYTVMLQPTSPLRNHHDIDKSIEYLNEKDANSIISVSKLSHPIEWVNKLPKDFSMKNFFSRKDKIKRSQDYEKSYIINGAIYIIRNKILISQKKLFLKERCYGYLMDQDKSIDIDNKLDLNIAEVLLKNGK